MEEGGGHAFVVDLGITHVPMDTSNVRPKRACQVMDLRSPAVPRLRFDVRLTSPWTIDGVLHLGNRYTGSPNEGLEDGCLEHRPPAQFDM